MAIAELHKTTRTRAAQGTRPGTKSPSNEDSVVVRRLRHGTAEVLLCAVADGVGGLERGEIASRAAIRGIESFPHDLDGDLGHALKAAVLAAHERVRREAAGEGPTGGATTMVAAVLRGSELWVVNAGDSRAYLLIPGKEMLQVTADHSWVQEQVRAGVLDQTAAAHHPQRKLITRCLGGPDVPEVDLFYRRIPAGCRLLLCSDGLTEVVPDAEIADVLASRDERGAVTALLDLAARRGATDDVTVCVVHPHVPPGALPADPDEVTGGHRVLATPGGAIAGAVHPTPSRRSRRVSVSWLLWLSFPAAVVLLGATLWRVTDDVIVPGVSAAGVPVDGRTREEAATMVTAAATPSLSCATPLLAEGTRWTRSAAELGVSVDGRATAEGAWLLGHRGSVAEQARQRVDVAFGGAAIPPVYRVDQEVLTRGLQDLNSMYTAAAAGRAIDIPRAVGVASRQLAEEPCAPLELPTVAVAVPLPPPAAPSEPGILVAPESTPGNEAPAP